MLLVGREPDAPYNRPNCSKGYLRGEEAREQALFRPGEWWGEQRIELLTRTSVMALDLETRTAKLSSKEEIEFDKALIATGANVRRLNVDGCRAGGDPLPAHARQRRRDPQGGGGCAGGRADRRLLHWLRGRRVADRDGQALHDRDAGADDARTGLRRARGTVLSGAARIPRRDRARRRRARALRGGWTGRQGRDPRRPRAGGRRRRDRRGRDARRAARAAGRP